MRYEDLKPFCAAASRFIQSKAPVAAYFGGIANQKTISGCVKVLSHIAEHPKSRWVIGRKIARSLKATTQREFADLADSLGWIIRYNEHDGIMRFRNGAEINFWAFEEGVSKGIRKFENFNATGVWLDQAEDFEEAYYDAILRRVRSGKDEALQILLTGNPAGHNWIWRFGVNNDTRDEDWDLVEATTYENAYLPERFLKNIDKLPPDLKKRYVYGSWDVFAGQIFHQFIDIPAPAGHLAKPFDIPLEWPRWRGIDHGYRHPAGCVWLTRSPDGIYFVYRCYKQAERTAQENAAEITSLSGQERYQLDIMDSACFANTGAKLTIAEEYSHSSHGRISPAPSRKTDEFTGINNLAEWLQDRNTPDGGPALRIFESCFELRNEIVSYRWAEATRTYLRHEKPEDANNDLIDPLIYLMTMIYQHKPKVIIEKLHEIKPLKLDAILDRIMKEKRGLDRGRKDKFG